MRRLTWVLLVLVSAGGWLAWGQSAQGWGQWGRSSQHGVEVRAFCSSDVPLRANPSVVMSLWKYQLRNTTMAPVSVHWRVEHFDGAAGANKLGAPTVAVLRAGKMSAVYQTSLVGSCAALPAIHLVVAPRERDRGGKNSRAETAREQAGTSFAYKGAAVAPAQGGRPENQPSPTAVAAVAGSSWRCQLKEDTTHTFAISFDNGGRYFITRDDGRDTFPGSSQIDGNQITWADEFGRLYSLQVNGDAISGRTSTFDLAESRGREYHGRIACTRAAVNTR